MMALVAYSDQSDFSDSEDEQSLSNTTEVKKINNSSTLGENQSDSQLKEKCTKSTSSQSFIKPESSLEKVSSHGGPPDATDIVDDVPTVATWGITSNISNADKSAKQNLTSVTKITKSNKLKLVLPALSQFIDDDDDDDEDSSSREEVAKKRLKASNKGTDLFSLLPKPRGSTHLVPLHVARKMNKKSLPPVPKKKPVQEPTSHNDSDEDVSSTSVDFFSLTDSPPPASALAFPDSYSKSGLGSHNPPLFNGAPHTSEAPAHPSTEYCQEVSSTVSEQPWDTVHPAEVDRVNTESKRGGGLSGIDKEALRRLAGHRNKGQVPIIIDINADDALMPREEWVTRSLCDEKPKRSFSRKNEGNPTQQQKRKHQITYLAHQAQEREQELQNAWGQNRFTKLQTQSKYGF